MIAASVKIRSTSSLRPAGGVAGEIGIKVGNMMDSRCDANPSGGIADQLFLKRLPAASAAVRNHAR